MHTLRDRSSTQGDLNKRKSLLTFCETHVAARTTEACFTPVKTNSRYDTLR